MTYPCPHCGKPTRICQDEKLRICALCRKVSLASLCTPANAPRKTGGVNDSVGTTSEAFGWLDVEVAGPVHPCKNCGKETKEAQEKGKRSCRPCGLIQ